MALKWSTFSSLQVNHVGVAGTSRILPASQPKKLLTIHYCYGTRYEELICVSVFHSKSQVSSGVDMNDPFKVWRLHGISSNISITTVVIALVHYVADVVTKDALRPQTGDVLKSILDLLHRHTLLSLLILEWMEHARVFTANIGDHKALSFQVARCLNCGKYQGPVWIAKTPPFFQLIRVTFSNSKHFFSL